jgi:anti-anti-sigma factor
VTDPNALATFRLVGIPLAVHAHATQHMDALNRELEIIRRTDPDADTTPHRLHALSEELRAQFGGLGEAQNAELQAAIERGDDSIDLEYELPAAVADACQRLGDLLDEVDDYCREGEHLLTLVTPPEALTYRRWFLSEFIRQASGAAPTPWEDYTDSWTPAQTHRPAAAVPPTPPAQARTGLDVERTDAEAVVHVRDDLDLHSAPNLRAVLTDLHSDGPEKVTVDLSDCRFVDSVGISVLVSAYLRFTGDDTRFVLVAPVAIRQLLAVAGIADLLELVPSEPA